LDAESYVKTRPRLPFRPEIVVSPLWVGLVGLAACVTLLVAVWLLSLARRDASVIDAFWGPGFAMLAWIYLALGQPQAARAWIVASLTTIWGVRLSLHILLRARGQAEDYRYREMREKAGASFWWVSLFTVFLLQALLMWLISAPLLQAATATADLGWLDWAGVGLFAIGLFFESVGDRQLARFKADPANRGRVLQSGLWRYTRHPNYFGDAVLWWGLGLISLATPGSWWTLYAPTLMTVLLLRVSGVTLLEKKLVVTRPGYSDYVSRTSAFVPWIPKARRDA